MLDSRENGEQVPTPIVARESVQFVHDDCADAGQ